MTINGNRIPGGPPADLLPPPPGDEDAPDLDPTASPAHQQLLSMLGTDAGRAFDDQVLATAARLRRYSPGEYERLVVTLKQQHGATIRVSRWEQVVAQRAKTNGASSAPPWHRRLLRTSDGSVKAALQNAVCALGEDERWEGVLTWNQHSHLIEWRAELPWPIEDASTPTGVWTEHEDHLLVCLLESELGMSLRPSQARAAAAVIARRHPYHPVQQFLQALEWDTQPRINTWLPRYLGCSYQPAQYLADVGRWVLVGAVARAMVPGAKVDNVMVLEGAQGARKSSSISILGGRWYVEVDAAILGTVDKDTLLTCRRGWIVEAGEFDSLRDASMARLKNIVSRPVDTFRAPYGHDAISVDRGWIVIGTTNADAYLRDTTGARRFWPVRCGDIDLEALKRDRDQLWAEAMHLYRTDTKWWPERTDRQIVEDEQEERRHIDPWEQPIGAFLQRKAATSDHVTTAEILFQCLDKRVAEQERKDEMRVADCLRALGWRKGPRRRIGGVRVYPYLPPSEEPSEREPGEEG